MFINSQHIGFDQFVPFVLNKIIFKLFITPLGKELSILEREIDLRDCEVSKFLRNGVKTTRKKADQEDHLDCLIKPGDEIHQYDLLLRKLLEE